MSGHRREDRIDWVRCAPFIALHLACVGALFTGVSTGAVVTAAVLYLIRERKKVAA